MNHLCCLLSIGTLCSALLALPGNAQQSAAVQNVLNIKFVPDGRYAVGLVIEGEHVKTEFSVSEMKAHCTTSEETRGGSTPKGALGTFDAIGNGVFLLRLKGNDYRSSQFWLFKPDGSIQVKEFPDRGEKQTAVRVGALEGAVEQERPTIVSGRYEVTLEVDGKPMKNTFVIKNGAATCVKSDDKSLVGADAIFKPLRGSNTTFQLSLRGKQGYRSQIWEFLSDGSAIIKEIPDRGEKQKAVLTKEE